MTMKTATWVSDISDKPDDHGVLYVNVKFDDDTVAYKGGKPDTIGEHHAALLALVGVPAEYMLEDTGKKTAKGLDKYKIVGYPGWEPKADGGGGGGGGGKSWYNSEEGVRFTQDQMNRRTALMTAQALVGPGPHEPTLRIADDQVIVYARTLYDWLDSSASTTAQAEDQGHTNPGDAAGGPENGDSGVSISGPLISSGGEGPRVGEGGDPNLPTISRDRLWADLVDYAESEKKAQTLVSLTTHKSYDRPRDIPEADILATLRGYHLVEPS